MPTSTPLPDRVPDGTKYVVEGRGPLVHRYIEYPDGRRVGLPPRKAQLCTCAEASKIASNHPARKPAHRAA